ncbi:MAG: SDR family oxidoreductase [Actinobacteria bacterium]|jgi:short-subunit dehydrogenase|nr:SDR family oxidoreductase [Actinomycetota bacterium]
MKNLFSLDGRVALVTGGSRGIGFMIAQGLLEFGCARVYISARKASQCDEAARQLSQYGECISIPGDVSTLEGIKALVAEIEKREPALDILVNNAGAAWGEAWDTFPESGWDKVVDLNLKAPFFLTRELTPLLKAGVRNDHLAKVINIASIDGISVNMLETYSYAGSKAGLIHMTKRMAIQLAKDNIVMTAIAPGAFASEMNKAARDHGDAISAGIPAKRIGTTEDMAGAAVYLASRAGDYVLGSTLIVDGGVTYIR